MSKPLEDYAMIGNCRTAALVARDGSIDWLCLPDFAGGACFASLLGTAENGRWKIRPDGDYRVRRKYRGDSMVLETTFTTADGEVELIDFMPVPDATHEGTSGDANADVIRLVRGVRGRVRMHVEIEFRFDYGGTVPWVRRREDGLSVVAGPDAVVLRTPVPLRGEDFAHVAQFDVAEGELVPFDMTWFPSNHRTPGARDVRRLLSETEQFWQDWTRGCQVCHKWRGPVMRSLVTLKALTFAPTGGIVAAPTTSLPEDLGGVRNWDYRFCWVRDASLTLYSLLSAGFYREAGAWRDWLLRAAAGKPGDLQIMYGIRGERRLNETTLPWLAGYEGSKPVRIGNGAHDQFQLDVYGELMSVLHLARQAGVGRRSPGPVDEDPDAAAWRFQRSVMDFLESAWAKPDSGIWEVRGPKRHFTHSKVMAWVGVDRSIQSAEQFNLEAPLDRWRALRDEIHRDVCTKGFDAERNTFTQYYGGKPLDASLLTIPMVGFLPGSDPRVKGTIAAIERELMWDGYLLRYPLESPGESSHDVDGLPGGEGAFLPCSFWLADAMARSGRVEDATALFDRLLTISNDVGLFAEEYDPRYQRMVGNFPQAFTHVALLDAAAQLAAVEAGHAGAVQL